MINLKIMVGSISEKNSSKSFAHHIQKRYADTLHVTIIDLDLPLYNGDVDNDAKRPEKIQAFYNELESADAFMMITPEYNNSVSGVLKNAIDWASRSPHFLEKVGLIATTSMGMTGGARAYTHLHEILQRIPMHVLPGHEILVSRIHQKINDKGVLTDQETIELVDSVMDAFIAHYHMVKA